MLQDKISKDLNNFYFFCLNSEETVAEKKTIFCPVLLEANPNFFYYFYCIYSTTMIPLTLGGKTIYVKSPKVFIFKTFYPFPSFYFKVLHRVVEEIRSLKIEQYISNKERYSNSLNLGDLGLKFTLTALNIILKGTLTSFIEDSKLPLGEPESFDVNIFDKGLPCKMGRFELVPHKAALYSAIPVFKKLAFEDFLFIYMSIFSERKIVFVSSQRRIISQAM